MSAPPAPCDRLNELFKDLRPRSAVSLKHALDIKDTEGVAATLVVQIPTDPKKPVEIFMTTSPTAKLVTDLRFGVQP